MADNEARLDKWLWAARIFKTRSIAADACKNGRVMVNDVLVKPSRTVKVGDRVSVRKPPVTYSFRILKTIEQRVGAKLLPEIYENITPQDQRFRGPCPWHGATKKKRPKGNGCLCRPVARGLWRLRLRLRLGRR